MKFNTKETDMGNVVEMPKKASSKKKAEPKPKPAPEVKTAGGKKANGKAADPDVETIDTTVDGTNRKYLPGMEAKVVKPLIDLGKRHLETKAAHKELTDTLGKQASEGIVLFNKYKEHFREDEEGSGTWSYKGGGVELIVDIPTGEPKFKTKAVNEVEKANGKKNGSE